MSRGQNNSWVSRSFRGQASPEIQRIDQHHAPSPPSFAFLHKLLLVQVNSYTGGGNGLTRRIEQLDPHQLARTDQLVRAAIDQFVQHRFQPLLEYGSTK